MKLKDLRQKYNGLLEKLIRLFTLSGIMFTVTACYGVAPFETESKDFVDVEGRVLNEDNQPLESIQVVVKATDNQIHQHIDTFYTTNKGNYRARYIGRCLFEADEITIIANDTSKVYASDTVRVTPDEIKYVGMEEDSDWTINMYYSLDNDFQLKKNEVK